MMEPNTLETRLSRGELDATLKTLYGAGGMKSARERCTQVLERFRQTFDCPAEALFSAPGRTELGGNHTDHQHGRVLAAAVDLDILAAAAPNQSGMIRVQSQGYPLIVVDLRERDPRPEERNTSAALIRGVASRLAELGCSFAGAGVDVYMTSSVPGGSGLSSSAAFEVLMGTLLNDLFFGGRCTPVELAQIGQYAENVYFGKPCGLMDQTASSVGGVVAIDFADPAAPVVEQINLDLEANGYALCILDSGADHADLTAEYAAITEELQAVCGCFGKNVLREVPEEAFLAALPQVREKAGDRAALRAMHVYAENRRAKAQAAAQTEFITSGPWDGDQLVYFTCLPWFPLTALKNEKDVNPSDSVPRAAWGRWEEEGSRTRLLLSLELNHRLLDGVHVGRFYEALNRWMEGL